jgi:hypothetical protein
LLFFLLRVVFFRIFVFQNQCLMCGFPSFSSASALVASVGLASLRSLFAGFVLGIPAGPGSSPSVRVAAAVPAFVGALVGRGLCCWSVGWSVASLVAGSWGVVVGSGGVPLGGRQLSLFS